MKRHKVKERAKKHKKEKRSKKDDEEKQLLKAAKKFLKNSTPTQFCFALSHATQQKELV